MGKKRAPGEGAVFQRKKTGVWVAVVRYTDRNGEQKKIWRTAKNEPEANRIARILKQEQEQGLLAGSNKQTVAQYFDYWLHNAKQWRLRSGSFRVYESHIRLHIKPILGRRALKDLTIADVERLFKEGRKNKRAPESVIQTWKIFKQGLDRAVKERLISANVAEDVEELPEITPKKKRVLSKKEIALFLEVLQGHRFETAVWVGLTTGLRIGEVFGLRWAAINLETGQLEVRESLNDRDRTLGPPKTKSSNRFVGIPPKVLERLKVHKEQQDQERAVLGDQWQDHDLVFPTYKGTAIAMRRVRLRLRNVLDSIGLKDVSFHSFRHNYATAQADKGAHPVKVRDAMGHSSIRMMGRYSHTFDSAIQELANNMEDFLWGSPE